MNEVDKLLKEFEQSFVKFGLEDILRKAKAVITKQRKRYDKPSLYYLYANTTALRKSDADKKAWNMRAFKLNYKDWLKRFVSALKWEKKKNSSLNVTEILKPFLTVKWDNMCISELAIGETLVVSAFSAKEKAWIEKFKKAGIPILDAVVVRKSTDLKFDKKDYDEKKVKDFLTSINYGISGIREDIDLRTKTPIVTVTVFSDRGAKQRMRNEMRRN